MWVPGLGMGMGPGETDNTLISYRAAELGRGNSPIHTLRYPRSWSRLTEASGEP